MKSAGFTLLEILLSIAAISIIVGITIPLYLSFQNKNELDIAIVTVAQTMRRAQLLAQAVDDDVAWGVYVQSGSITLFKGEEYASRDSDFDEVFDIPSNITISGTQEYIFTKFTGELEDDGSLTLTSVNNATRTITTNTAGMLQY